MATNPTMKERPSEEMGQIFTSIMVTNATDLDNAEAGLIAPGELRSTGVDNVLVDTGATYLSLPADIIARLGLRVARTVRLETANGEVVTRLFRNAQVELLGRETTGMCVELPVGSRPLLETLPPELLLAPPAEPLPLRSLCALAAGD